MATQVAEAVSVRTGGGAFAAWADRWIWAFMAALFFATVLLGFVPDSIGMVAVVISDFAFLASSARNYLSAEALDGRKFATSHLLLEQARLVFVFAVLVMWALLVRRQAPETHKRLIFFATLMPAAFNRIPWLPSTLPDSPTSNLLLMLLWLSPLLI